MRNFVAESHLCIGERLKMQIYEGDGSDCFRFYSAQEAKMTYPLDPPNTRERKRNPVKKSTGKNHAARRNWH